MKGNFTLALGVQYVLNSSLPVVRKETGLLFGVLYTKLGHTVEKIEVLVILFVLPLMLSMLIEFFSSLSQMPQDRSRLIGNGGHYLEEM